jgi:hypothetical protein
MATRSASQGARKDGDKGPRAAVVPTPMSPRREEDVYVLPLAHVRLPAAAVNAAFWSTLAGAMVLGAVDPPLALLIGGAVVVIRHRARA